MHRQVSEKKGVIGRFGVDFISIKEKDGWKHHAIEINLRKGGTTHPYLMLLGLTVGNMMQIQGYHTGMVNRGIIFHQTMYIVRRIADFLLTT